MTHTDPLPKVIVICGPTAIGKSDFAVDVALDLKQVGIHAEILSTDSRQIYTDLNIGTGKITHEEMRDVPHHMIDIISPIETYSVFSYAEKAHEIMQGIHAKGGVVILCGGTGQYIDALITGHSGAPVPPNEELRSDLEQRTIGEVDDMLQSVQKKHGCDIDHVDRKNKRRMIRAIEIIEALGHIPKIDTAKKYDVCWIGLDTESDTLRTRIQKRLIKRIEAGMVEESENLLEKGLLTHDRMYTLGLEYRYISLYLQGALSDTEWKEQLFFGIWHYAKRQRTWFKKYTDVQWFDPTKKSFDKKKIEILSLICMRMS